MFDLERLYPQQGPEEDAVGGAGGNPLSGGGGGGSVVSAIIAAVGNIASVVGSIISSKETTKQAEINKELGELNLKAAQIGLETEEQKTLQAAINGKKAELLAVKRSENIKTFNNTAIIFGVLTLAALVARWTLIPTASATASVKYPPTPNPK